jgi:hypothetical protein
MQPKPEQSKKSGSASATKPPQPGQAGDVGSPTAAGQGMSGQQTSGQQTRGQQTRGQQTSGGANDLLQQAKQTTSEVVDNVQQQAGSRLDRQKDEAANELQRLAGAVRNMGDELGGQQQGPIAQYAAEYGRKAAAGIDRFTQYLRTNDTRALVSEIENLGRRQPALLIGGAFLLGLAGARFLKSSRSPNGSFNEQQYAGRALPPPHQPSHVPTTTATL